MAEITEAYVKLLENTVLNRARQLANVEPPIEWAECLEDAANELCQGWEWVTSTFVTGEYENAMLRLTYYRGY